MEDRLGRSNCIACNFFKERYKMQKKSAIRTKPIPQRTKETSNCYGGLRFPVSSSRKVHGSLNSENWNLARPRYIKNLL